MRIAILVLILVGWRCVNAGPVTITVRVDNEPCPNAFVFGYGEDGVFAGVAEMTGGDGRAVFDLAPDRSLKFCTRYCGIAFWTPLLTANESGTIDLPVGSVLTLVWGDQPAGGRIVELWDESGKAYLGERLVSDTAGEVSFPVAADERFRFRVTDAGRHFFTDIVTAPASVCASIPLAADSTGVPAEGLTALSLVCVTITSGGASMRDCRVQLWDETGSIFLGQERRTTVAGKAVFYVSPGVAVKLRLVDHEESGIDLWTDVLTAPESTVLDTPVLTTVRITAIDQPVAGRVVQMWDASKSTYLGMEELTNGEGIARFRVEAETHPEVTFGVEYAGGTHFSERIAIPGAVVFAFDQMDPPDTTPPVTVHDYEHDGQWSSESAFIILSATDEFGLAMTRFSIDGGAMETGVHAIIQTEGLHTLTFYSIDLHGNEEEPSTVEVKLDLTPPELEVLFPANRAELTTSRPTIRARLADELSGIALESVSLSVDPIGELTPTLENGELTYTPAMDWENGTYSLFILAKDVAGNVTSAVSRFDIAVPRPPTLVQVQPAFDTASGGKWITLSGSWFTGETAVTFGGVPAREVSLLHRGEMKALSPACAPGTVDVVVSTEWGEASLPFLYQDELRLVLDGAEPDSLFWTSGDKVCLSGSIGGGLPPYTLTITHYSDPATYAYILDEPGPVSVDLDAEEGLHYVFVMLEDSAENVTWSRLYYGKDTTPPEPPGPLHAYPSVDAVGGVAMWLPSPSLDAVQYKVNGEPQDAAVVNTRTISGLTEGETCTVEVVAVDRAGNESAPVRATFTAQKISDLHEQKKKVETLRLWLDGTTTGEVWSNRFGTVEELKQVQGALAAMNVDRGGAGGGAGDDVHLDVSLKQIGVIIGCATPYVQPGQELPVQANVWYECSAIPLNGVRDPVESEYLDLNSNGQWDSGEPWTERHVLSIPAWIECAESTAWVGNYDGSRFVGLHPGEYTVTTPQGGKLVVTVIGVDVTIFDGTGNRLSDLNEELYGALIATNTAGSIHFDSYMPASTEGSYSISIGPGVELWQGEQLILAENSATLGLQRADFEGREYRLLGQGIASSTVDFAFHPEVGVPTRDSVRASIVDICISAARAWVFWGRTKRLQLLPEEAVVEDPESGFSISAPNGFNWQVDEIIGLYRIDFVGTSGAIERITLERPGWGELLASTDSFLRGTAGGVKDWLQSNGTRVIYSTNQDESEIAVEAECFFTWDRERCSTTGLRAVPIPAETGEGE